MLPTVCFEAGRFPKLNLPPGSSSLCAQMNVWSRLAGDPKTRLKKLASGTTPTEVPGRGLLGRMDNSVYPLTFTYHECPRVPPRPVP